MARQRDRRRRSLREPQPLALHGFSTPSLLCRERARPIASRQRGTEAISFSRSYRLKEKEPLSDGIRRHRPLDRADRASEEHRGSRQYE